MAETWIKIWLRICILFFWTKKYGLASNDIFSYIQKMYIDIFEKMFLRLTEEAKIEINDGWTVGLMTGVDDGIVGQSMASDC